MPRNSSKDTAGQSNPDTELLLREIRKNREEFTKEIQDLKKTMKDYTDKQVEETKNHIMEEMKHRFSNQRNIILNGISEEKEDVKKEVEVILKEICIQDTIADISTAFRLGKQQRNKTRPVKVCFYSMSSAERALKNRSLLKEKGLNNIFINEDLTKEQMKDLRDMKDEAKRMNERGENLKNGESWIIVGRRTNPRMKKIMK